VVTDFIGKKMVEKDLFSPWNSDFKWNEIICHENTCGTYWAQYQVVFSRLFANRTIFAILILAIVCFILPND
jgi:hypothetical protein